MNRSAGFVSMSIGLVLIFSGVAVKEYNTFNHPPLNPPLTQNNQTAQTAGWKTYTDNQYHFSIDYPADFTISEDPGQSVSLNAKVSDYFKTKLAGEAKIIIANADQNCPASQGESFTATTTFNSPAGAWQKIGWTGVGAGNFYQGADYHLIKNGLCYSLTVFYHGANDAGLFPDYNTPEKIAVANAQNNSDKTAFFDLGEKIISTFRFTQ